VAEYTDLDIREVKVSRFTGTGDIHVPVLVNWGTTCYLRNPGYSSVRNLSENGNFR
jgi:hypothetical protein